MDPQTILDYWVKPDAILDLGTADLFREKTLLVVGGRGCGKTMLLRWLSFEVQALEAARQKTTLTAHIEKQGGVAFYIRIDSGVLNGFRGLGLAQPKWQALFAHFLELAVAHSYLVFVETAYRAGEFSAERSGELVAELQRVFGTEAASFSAIRQHIESEIERLDAYRRKVVFVKHEFEPPRVFGVGDLSTRIPRLICGADPRLRQARLLVAIDEYENFDEDQQRLINGLVKSGTEHVGFRLGMRLEGMKTFAVGNSEDFLKEGHDYRVVRFQTVVGQEGYFEFLQNLANTRLKNNTFSRRAGLDDIKSILGEPDWEAEARQIVETSGRKSAHFDPLRTKFGPRFEEVVSQIRYPENPLLEMLNVVYVLRGENPHAVRREMLEYVRARGTRRRGRPKSEYQSDYVHKYKLAALFLLANLHDRRPRYYGFDIFGFLSAHTARNFINLCKTAFNRAHYRLGHRFLDERRIPAEIQDEAAHLEAERELQSLKAIPQHGDQIQRLALNIGTYLAREYHSDPLLRYPENNTFTFQTLSKENQLVLQSAVRWSVLLPKARPQKAGIGGAPVTLYTLNRMLSPLFLISFRTRGGIVRKFTNEDFNVLATSEKGLGSARGSARVRKKKRLSRSRQQTLDDDRGDSA